MDDIQITIENNNGQHHSESIMDNILMILIFPWHQFSCGCCRGANEVRGTIAILHELLSLRGTFVANRDQGCFKEIGVI